MQELKSDIYEILKKSEDSDNKMKNEFRILRQELHKLQVDTNIILQLHKCNEDNDEILEYESNDYDDTDLLQMEINMPETVCDVSRSRSHSLSSLKGVVKTFFG